MHPAPPAGNAAIAASSSDWLAHYYLGQAYTSDEQFAEAEEPLRTALSKARASDQQLVRKQLGFAYEKQKKYAQSIDAYQSAGDQAGVQRVKKSEETERLNRQIEADNLEIEKMRAEALALEEELKALEKGGGGC